MYINGTLWAWPSWLAPYTVLWLALALLALALLWRIVKLEEPSQRISLFLAGVLSALWWTVAGRGNAECVGKFVAASLAAFALGTLCGFVFSSTTGESDSIGKVRDWLVGGVAALSVAQIASGGHTIRKVLEIFVPRGCPDDFAVIAGMAVVYAVGGFFLMFFNRELILNILLAQRRALAQQAFDKSSAAADRKIVEAAGVAPGMIDWQTTAQQEPIELNPEVRDYVREVEAKLRNNERVSLEDIKKTAVVLTLGGENIRATEFLKLALQKNPGDEEIVIMLAKTLAELGEREQAINYLLEFKKQSSKASKIDKLLGFYLLWSTDVEGLEKSAQYTSNYLNDVVPTDDGAIFNLACANAQLFGLGKGDEYRQRSLERLKQAIAANKVWKERALELTGVDGDFVSLKDYSEFKNLTQKT